MYNGRVFRKIEETRITIQSPQKETGDINNERKQFPLQLLLWSPILVKVDKKRKRRQSQKLKKNSEYVLGTEEKRKRKYRDAKLSL